MGYYDGNTVTAMWQYAQHFAMSDNAYTDTYGPSTPGVLNLVAGQTNGMQIVAASKNPSTLAAVSYYIGDGAGGLTMINDVDPGYDVCSVPKDQAMMTGKNIGDLLNAARRDVGRLHGRLQPGNQKCERHDRMQAQHAFDGGGHRCRRLHRAPQLVPVFRVDRQSQSCPPEFDAGDRLYVRA